MLWTVPGALPGELVGRIIIAVDAVLEHERPDALLVLGDTNSALGVIAAKRRRVPIFHMEAGNRCFDQRVPEETNRRIVDHVSDINLPYSAIARSYLLTEGIDADRIITTGSPMREVLEHYRPDIELSSARDRLGLEPEKYFVVSCHRQENVDAPERLAMLHRTLGALAGVYRLPIVFSVHPRTRQRIEAAGLSFDPLIKLLKPLGFIDYVALQMQARAVLSDSGTISEEAAILGFPAINLRDAHERPEAMEESAVVMTGLDPSRVLQGLALVLAEGQPARLPSDYEPLDVSRKVARIIMSYTDYVRRTVWRED